MEIKRSKSIFKFKSIVKMLIEFNRDKNAFLTGPSAYKHNKWVSFYATEDGKLLGGALCQPKWGWLYLDTLCVDEQHRGRDIGTKLVAEAEKYARENGCEGVNVDTFDFQARPFYEKMGFVVTGKIEGMPPGSTTWSLAKKF